MTHGWMMCFKGHKSTRKVTQSYGRHFFLMLIPQNLKQFHRSFPLLSRFFSHHVLIFHCNIKLCTIMATVRERKHASVYNTVIETYITKIVLQKLNKLGSCIYVHTAVSRLKKKLGAPFHCKKTSWCFCHHASHAFLVSLRNEDYFYRTLQIFN